MTSEPAPQEQSPDDECSCGHQRKDHEGERCTRCSLPRGQTWNHAFIWDAEANTAN